jgi:hypothetical protein
MSPYLAAGAFIAFLVWSGAMVAAGYKYEASVCAAGDSAHDLAASQAAVAAHVAVEGVMTKQNNANQEAVDVYHKNINSTDAKYISDGLQPATAGIVHNLRSIGRTATGVKTPVCEKVSRSYGMTFQECDKQMDGYWALWNDWMAQAAIK